MSEPLTQEYLDQSIGALKAQLDASFDAKIDEVLEVVHVDFTEVHGRFDRLEQQVDVLKNKSDQRYEVLRGTLDVINRQGIEIVQHREKLDLCDSRLGVLERGT